MKTNAIAALLSALCALFFCPPSSLGQGSQAFDTLNVSGTATIGTLGSGTATITSGTINTLVVTGSSTLQGPVDLFANSLLFGSQSDGQRGLTFTYTDSVSTPSIMEFIANRPSFEWRWERPATSGTGIISMMRLNSNHVLTLFDSTGNPAVVLDPANQGGATGVLTQQVADTRYITNNNFTIGSGTDRLNRVSPNIALTGGTARGPWSFAGLGATASGSTSLALGHGAKSTGNTSAAFGMGATAKGNDAIAVGSSAKALGEFSNAFGNGSYALGHSSTAIGFCTNTEGYGSFSSGFFSYAGGDLSIASGFCSYSSGSCSTASGACSVSGGWGSTAAGYMTNAQGCLVTVVGVCNLPQGNPAAWVPTDDLFVIGNGTFSYDTWGNSLFDEHGNLCADTQSNALVVKKNGNTTVYGSFTVTGTNAGLVVTGTAVQVTTTSGTGTKIVASGSSQLVLIPEQGDLSMGDFINGKKPIQ